MIRDASLMSRGDGQKYLWSCVVRCNRPGLDGRAQGPSSYPWPDIVILYSRTDCNLWKREACRRNTIARTRLSKDCVAVVRITTAGNQIWSNCVQPRPQPDFPVVWVIPFHHPIPMRISFWTDWDWLRSLYFVGLWGNPNPISSRDDHKANK